MEVFPLVSLAFCIFAVQATDVEDILQRLSDIENKERNYEERIHNLEAEIAAKDTLITELNQRLTKLEDRTEVGTQVQEENGDSLAVSNKDNSPHNWTGKRFVVNPEVGVAFHVVLSQGKEYAHYGANQPIVFDQVRLNIGDGYKSSHGIFTAPLDGVYMFSASILSYVDPRPEISGAIAKNGSPLGGIYGHGDSGRHDQGSVTVVTQLTTGDEVTVEIISPDGSIWGNSYTSFAGVLLMPV